MRIYEYQPTMMHAKTFVVDGVWSTVGSLNFDNRSLVFNNESNIVALDERVGATLDSLFMDDLRYAKEIKLAEFERRSWAREDCSSGERTRCSACSDRERVRRASRECRRGRVRRARPHAWRRAASSLDAGESSRTWISIPSATGMRRQANVSLIVLRDGDVGTDAECRRERLGDSPLEQVAGGLPHLALDDLERLALALADL